MSFPTYESTKDSGHDWLGDIPAHWHLRKFRHCYEESAEKIESSVVGPMLSVSGYRGVEIKDYDDENRRRLEEDLVGYRIVRPGQLVVNTMWLNYAGLGVSAFEGHVSPAYRSYRIGNRLVGPYVHHLMRSAAFVRGYTKYLSGVRPNSLQMSRDDLMSFPVLEPPMSEQVAIAAFLDRETAKIDALVEEQKRLVELLKEKRQAVISQAVTKGVDPNVPMKDSGVEWLGKVPAHWVVMPIRFAARIESGHTPSRSRPDWWENCTVPWFTLADVWQIRQGADVIFETTEMVSELGLANSSARRLPKGTVMLSRTASVGFSAIMGTDMATTQDFANWVCGEKLLPEFLLCVFRSMSGEFRRLMMGSTHNTIYMPDIQALRFALPPMPEQREIVKRLRQATASFDGLMSEAQRGVDLLSERRSALISAAVTGKIDVRGLAPQPEGAAA